MVTVGSLMNDLIGSQLLISIVYSGWFSQVHKDYACSQLLLRHRILCSDSVSAYCFSVSFVVSVLRIFRYLLDTC
jgi:hypothetical protein